MRVANCKPGGVPVLVIFFFLRIELAVRDVVDVFFRLKQKHARRQPDFEARQKKQRHVQRHAVARDLGLGREVVGQVLRDNVLGLDPRLLLGELQKTSFAFLGLLFELLKKVRKVLPRLLVDLVFLAFLAVA